MPVKRSVRAADYFLNDKPYMLVRQQGRRAWHRSGVPDTAGRPLTADDVEHGALPEEIEFVDVWDDWSGGFGDAYRRRDHRNAVHWSENMDTRFPQQMVHCQQMRTLDGLLFASTHSDANAFIDIPQGQGAPGFGAVLIMGRGYVQRLDPVTDSSFIRTFEATGGGTAPFGRVGPPAIFGDYVMIPAPPSNFYMRTVATPTYTQSLLPARGFKAAGGRLWRSFAGFVLQSLPIGADPTATSDWSASLAVGDGQMFISTMEELGNQLFLGLPNGLYAGDLTGTFLNVLPEAYGQNVDTARDLVVHNGWMVSSGQAQVYAYRPSTDTALVREIGPGGVMSGRSPVVGRFRAFRQLGKWLFGGLWTGSQSYIMAGYDASFPLPYTWHVQQRLPHSAAPYRMHIDSITTNSGGQEIAQRFWVATDSSLAGTAPVYFFPIPRAHDNPLADEAFIPNYTGSARVDFPESDRGAPGTPKLYRSVEVEADLLLSGERYVDVYYTIDGGARTLLGRAQESPKSTLYFPSSEGSYVTGHRIALSVESFTTASITPIYRNVMVRGTYRPKIAETIQAVTRIADDLRDRHGHALRPASVMLGELQALSRDVEPAHLVDLSGATQIVAVIGPVEEEEMYQRNDDAPEIAATVKMAVLEFTAAA